MPRIPEMTRIPPSQPAEAPAPLPAAIFLPGRPRPGRDAATEADIAVVLEVLGEQLDPAWWVLRDRNLSGPSGPVAVDFIAAHPERGVVILLLAPPQSPIEPLFHAHLTATGFFTLVPGELAIRSLDLTAISDADDLVPSMIRVFSSGPRTSLDDPDWIEALVDCLSMPVFPGRRSGSVPPPKPAKPGKSKQKPIPAPAQPPAPMPRQRMRVMAAILLGLIIGIAGALIARTHPAPLKAALDAGSIRLTQILRR